MTRRVGVVGATGRMGRAVCAAVTGDPDLELVAAVARSGAGTEVEGVPVSSELRALADAGAEVLVDFTNADAARVTLPWAAMHGLHAVVGTSGLGDDDMAALARSFTASSCLVASNFAISAVLMMRFAELAAPWFDTADVVELHHDGKIDAPSGTAVATANRMGAASAEWAPDPTRHETLAGVRGGTTPVGVRVHSLRVRGMVAHQEVILGGSGQTLTIRQDSYDRVSYMPGVVLACRRVHERPGLTIGLDALLGV